MTRNLRAAAPCLAALLLLSAPAGCGGPPPEPASPSVAPDSEEGRKALAEDEALRRARQAEEARARKRVRGLPTDG